ncbi:MAG: hypothetical protein K9M12_00600 [Candidatus Pacebacteria bacterium]|nr:hypothetical protein [Candidatus Paceibacterota bacterium]
MAKISPLTQKIIKDFSREKKSSKKKSDYFVRIERTPRNSVFRNKMIEKGEKGEKRALRRKVVVFFLRKRLFSKDLLQTNPKSNARLLFAEIISRGYLSKNKIKNLKFQKVSAVLEKYSYLLRHSPDQRMGFKWWIIEVASCELEEVIWSAKEEKIFTSYMARYLMEEAEIESSSKKINSTFLFRISSKKAIFKGVDLPVFSYYFIKNKYPFWSEASEKDLEKVITTISEDKEDIEKEFRGTAYKKVFLFCKKNTLPFLAIKDLFNQNSKKIKSLLSDPQEVEKEVKKIYEEKKKEVEKTIYLSTTTLAFFLFIFNFSFFNFTVNNFDALIGVFLLPFLVLLLTVSTSLPLDKNKNKLLLKVIDIVYKKENKEKRKISLKKHKKSVVFAINMFYSLFFVVLIALFIFILFIVEMKTSNSFVFFFLLLLSSFLMVKIRKKVKDLFVIEKKEKITEVALDALSFPLIKVEKALEINEKKCHPAFIITEALIKMRKKDIVDLFNNWKLKLKQKKEKIYEI